MEAVDLNQRVRAIIKAIQPQTLSKSILAQIITQDFVWIPPKYHPTQYVGIDEVFGYLEQINSALPDLKHQIKAEIHSKETSWLLIISSGTHLGKFLAIDATENKIEYEQVVIINWNAEGKASQIKIINDSLTIFQQFGAAVIRENDELKMEQYIDSLKSVGLLPYNH